MKEIFELSYYGRLECSFILSLSPDERSHFYRLLNEAREKDNKTGESLFNSM